MEWKTTWNDPLTSYVDAFDDLIGDKRARKTFEETASRVMSGYREYSSRCQWP